MGLAIILVKIQLHTWFDNKKEDDF